MHLAIQVQIVKRKEMEKGKEESGRAFGYPRYAVVRYAQWEPGLYIEVHLGPWKILKGWTRGLTQLIRGCEYQIY